MENDKIDVIQQAKAFMLCIRQTKGNGKGLLKTANSIRSFYAAQYEEAGTDRDVEDSQRECKTRELVFQIILRMELHCSLGTDPIAKDSLKEINKLCQSVSVLLIFPGLEQWLRLIDLIFDNYHKRLPGTVDKLFDKLDVKAHVVDKAASSLPVEQEKKVRRTDKKELKFELSSKIERRTETKEKVSLGSLRKQEKRKRSSTSLPQQQPLREKKISVMTKKQKD